MLDSLADVIQTDAHGLRRSEAVQAHMAAAQAALADAEYLVAQPVDTSAEHHTDHGLKVRHNILHYFVTFVIYVLYFVSNFITHP